MMNRLKHLLGGHLLELNASVRAIFSPARGISPEQQKKFLLFGRGRSGSTLLVKMLNQHPEIDCQGEILRYRTLFPVSYIKNRLRVRASPFIGFKLLSYQIRDFYDLAGQKKIQHWIRENDVHIIHLQRENLLRHAISNIYAARRGAYHSTDKKYALHEKIIIHPQELIRWMEGSAALLKFEREFLNEVDTKTETVIYERDLENEQTQRATCNRLVTFLNLYPHHPIIDLQKVTPKDLSSIIENFAEIEQALTNTPYEQFLQS